MSSHRKLKIEYRPVAELISDGRNPRRHSKSQIDQLVTSISRFGWTNPILVDMTGAVIAGEARLTAARDRGQPSVPVIVLPHLTGDERRAYQIADNQIATKAKWNDDLLGEILAELFTAEINLDGLGFDPGELDKLIAPVLSNVADDTPTPELSDDTVSRAGEVWQLGEHRLFCGSSTSPEAEAIAANADMVCSDPPYCSGGFQESSKSIGSVGTNVAHKQIANDRLSTRGYQSLIRDAVFRAPCDFFYVFTDWRMWTYLFDVSESAGAGVRSMIVWDKGTPGMGRGWRAQHELVMFSARSSPDYPKGFPGYGNVFSAKRTGNKLHTTEKPVELIEALLRASPFGKTIYDPFLGSGTTLIAAEKQGRVCRGCELDLPYCDVIVKRWQDFTGEKAVLEQTGETFDSRAERSYVANAPIHE